MENNIIKQCMSNKYLRLLPLILYPYAYIIYINVGTTLLLLESAFLEYIISHTSSFFVIIYQLLTICAILYSTVKITKDNHTVYDATKTNLVMKCGHIPSYILHFYLVYHGYCLGGAFGTALSVLAMIMNTITILISGIYACGCMVKLRKEKVFSTPKAILASMASFVYGIDIVLAIVLFCVNRKQKDAQQAQDMV